MAKESEGPESRIRSPAPTEQRTQPLLRPQGDVMSTHVFSQASATGRGSTSDEPACSSLTSPYYVPLCRSHVDSEDVASHPVRHIGKVSRYQYHFVPVRSVRSVENRGKLEGPCLCRECFQGLGWTSPQKVQFGLASGLTVGRPVCLAESPFQGGNDSRSYEARTSFRQNTHV